MTDQTTDPPIFVPVALRLDEARALFNAARSVFGALGSMGLGSTDGGELARGMVALATAIDKAAGDTGRPCPLTGRPTPCEPCDLCPENDDETGD